MRASRMRVSASASGSAATLALEPRAQRGLEVVALEQRLAGAEIRAARVLRGVGDDPAPTGASPRARPARLVLPASKRAMRASAASAAAGSVAERGRRARSARSEVGVVGDDRREAHVRSRAPRARARRRAPRRRDSAAGAEQRRCRALAPTPHGVKRSRSIDSVKARKASSRRDASMRLGRAVLVRDHLVEARGRVDEILELGRIEEQALGRMPLDVLGREVDVEIGEREQVAGRVLAVAVAIRHAAAARRPRARRRPAGCAAARRSSARARRRRARSPRARPARSACRPPSASSASSSATRSLEAAEHDRGRRQLEPTSSRVTSDAQVDADRARLGERVAERGAAQRLGRERRLALGGEPVGSRREVVGAQPLERARLANAIAPSMWPARSASACSRSRFSRRSSELR